MPHLDQAGRRQLWKAPEVAECTEYTEYTECIEYTEYTEHTENHTHTRRGSVGLKHPQRFGQACEHANEH
jgi:hypothetical protein